MGDDAANLRRERDRRIWIWIFGMVASGIIGGLVAMATRQDYTTRADILFWYGVVAGVCAFGCLRLWLAR
jgi:hypothetical protein